VILREAGGIASDLSGGQNMLDGGTILASNGHLHGPLLKLLGGT
jgi:myo-inositol-1(or 4)-monophosphatase